MTGGLSMLVPPLLTPGTSLLTPGTLPESTSGFRLEPPF
jgi:hypothetical protein